MLSAASRRSPACPPYAESKRANARSAAAAKRGSIVLDNATGAGASAALSTAAA